MPDLSFQDALFRLARKNRICASCDERKVTFMFWCPGEGHHWDPICRDCMKQLAIAAYNGFQISEALIGSTDD